MAQVKILQAQLDAIGRPDKAWTWAVACSEQSWDLILRTAQDDQTCCAFSILAYIKGARLSDPLSQVTPGYLVAHELGHITTGSTQEKDADNWANVRGYRWGHKDSEGRN